MTREEIVAVLLKKDSTILSFPDRGPWGDSRYRGNCSGYIQAFCMWKYNVQKFAELFAGSGTGYDVARDMRVPYIGADLNPTPARPGIIQVDAFTDDVPEAFSESDFIFMHPPYGLEIKIPYAGSMYPDPTGELSKKDLGQMPWKQFMETLNAVVMKYYAAMQKGARMGILMGDVRRNGFHSMLADIVKPGELDQIIVKSQHNTVSGSRSYSKKNFVPIDHEFLMILRKPGEYVIAYKLPSEYQMDIRDSKSATWRDVVKAAMEHLDGRASLSQLYDELKDHAKAKANPHWQEKIRQTLQMSNLFTSSERGMWALAA